MLCTSQVGLLALSFLESDTTSCERQVNILEAQQVRAAYRQHGAWQGLWRSLGGSEGDSLRTFTFLGSRRSGFTTLK